MAKRFTIKTQRYKLSNFLNKKLLEALIGEQQYNGRKNNLKKKLKSVISSHSCHGNAGLKLRGNGC